MQKHVPANVDAKAGARFFTQVPLGSILTLGCSLVLSEMSKKLNLTFFFFAGRGSTAVGVILYLCPKA